MPAEVSDEVPLPTETGDYPDGEGKVQGAVQDHDHGSDWEKLDFNSFSFWIRDDIILSTCQEARGAIVRRWRTC